MKNISFTTVIVLLVGVVVLLAIFIPATRGVLQTPQSFDFNSVKTYKDIPGITADEITAIEELQKRADSRRPLIYGTALTTETFIDENGKLGGFTVLLCDWLTALFGLHFRIEIHDLNNVLTKLKTGEIDIGAVTITEDRLKTYHMSDPIIHRSIKIMRIQGSPSLAEIVWSRPVRYVFVEGGTTLDSVTASFEPGSYEALVARNHKAAYEMLKNGEADAFIGTNIAEGAFDPYGGVLTEDFLPLIVTPVSLAVDDPDLEPLVSAVTKALTSGAFIHLTGLYRLGYQNYRKNKFLTQLSDEERAYVRNTPVIPFAAQFMSYPVSFYNTNEKKWEGVIFDLIEEVEKLTGCTFKLVNDETVDLPELMNLLEKGTAYTMPNLIQSDERRKRFIWPNAMYQLDRFALLSKRSFPNIELNDIPFTRVGYARGSAFGDFFKSWFPNALYAKEYPSTDDAFMALERGEVDLVMSSQSRLTALTNYYEFSDYKANYLFSIAFEASFGFNKDQAVLCSIVDKALELIDTARIMEQWMSRTYNIETMRLRGQRPWLFGTLVLFLCVLFLIAALFIRSRHTNKGLEKLVEDRTRELALQTTKLQAIFDSLPDIVFCKDLNLRYTQCNRLSEEYNGFTEADIIGKNDLESKKFPRTVAEQIMKADREAFKEGRKIVIEETIPYYNGVTRILETVRAPLLQEGVIVGLIVIARDITKRKEIERELAMQTVLLTTLFDSVPDLIFIKDSNYRFLQCNKSFLEHFGSFKEYAIGKNIFEAFNLPDEIAQGIMAWDKRVIDERQGFTFEEILPRFDGTVPVFEMIKSPLIMDGEVTGVLGIGRDITKRKEIERELAMQTTMLATLVDTIPDLIFAKNLQFRYMQCNKSFLDHVGVCREDIIGKDDLEGIKLPIALVEEYREWDRKVMREGKSFILEEHIPRFNGTNPLYETVKAPLILDGEVIGLLGISHDITQRKEMEQAALAASRSKSIFLANMSHEIRTPMNSIMGFLELAQDDEVSPITREYLAKIQINAEWLLQIINDILDISKIESGKMEMENIPFDMHDLFESCRTLIIPKAVEKGLMLQFYAEPSVGKRPLGDPTRLRQVLVNLLSNAVKFTNSGTVKVLTEIKEKTEKTATFHFEIKDSGIGMTSEQIEKIFEPFLQAETGTTRKYGGTGLGLAISKNLIERMGGRLSVESTPGVGSKFSFELTFDTIDVEDYGNIEWKFVLDEVEKPIFDGEVLLCEDNLMNQQVICEHLARVGLKTVVAENGKAGVEAVQSRMGKGKKQFDLIFMDMHMPVMDGLEASAKLLEYNTGIPIVAMTANVMSSDRENYKMSGIHDCVGKPFTSQELWRCLLKYLKPVRYKAVTRKETIRDNNDPKLLADFVKSHKNTFRDIRKALNKGDLKLAHRLAHTLKGSAGMIGRTELREIAHKVERALVNGETVVAEGFMSVLERTLDKTLAELKPLSKRQRPKTPPSMMLSAEKAHELLEKLEILLKGGNLDCLEMIGDLHMVEGSDTLTEQVEDFDFESALKTLAGLKQALEGRL